MTTYYVSSSGSDVNNGLGPDASHSTNKPWLTVGKALGASGIASGDTVHIAPGVYRETVVVLMTSATSETFVLGDPGNLQGFKDGSGVPLSPGFVRITGYTTNDTTNPSATTTLTINTRDWLTFEDIWLHCSGASNGLAITTSENITWRRCLVVTGDRAQTVLQVAVDVDIASNHLFEDCIFADDVQGATNILYSIPTSTTADYDAEVVFRNCIIRSGPGNPLFISGTGANSFKGGGVKVHNCTIFGGILTISGANIATSAGNKCECYNSLLMSTSISANTLGQWVEDYNLIYASTTHTNVTQGGNTIAASGDMTHALMLEFGQSQLWGFQPRSPLEPTLLSPQLGRGSDGSISIATDLFDRPRPSGGASASKAWGAQERGNTFAKETSTVRTGSNAMSITGPGIQDFQLPVSAASTTITAYVRWDSTYTGTKPMMKVLNGGEIGISDDTDTATGSADTWEQLSLTFTPSAVGIVTVRFQSSDTNGGGEMYVDDFEVV